MCVAIALAVSELPFATVEGLAERVYDRGGEREVRFYRQARPALLPVWWDGRLQVVHWGNQHRHDRRLPPTSWTWRESVEGGRWAEMRPEPVVIPASYGLENGVWFRVKQGIEGIVVRDERGSPVVYMVCEAATRYYQVMTRADWMPVLVDEVI